MNNKSPINQDDINKAVQATFDTFRGTVDPSIYKNFILTMLFLKYISDVHEDKRTELSAQFDGKQARKNHNGSKKYALFGQEAISSTW